MIKNLAAMIALTSLFAGLSSHAQSSEDDWKPATSNQKGKQYPMVNWEGCVRARISVSFQN